MTPWPAAMLATGAAFVALAIVYAYVAPARAHRNARALDRRAADWQPTVRCPFTWWRTGECFTCERRAGHRGRHRMQAVASELTARRNVS